MTVNDVIEAIKLESNYIINSMILKSSDSNGAVYKWLSKTSDGMACRREIFIATEGEVTGGITERTVLISIEIVPAE